MSAPASAASPGQATGPPTEVAFYGGLGEIGANMATVEVDGRIAVVDVGLTFPDAEHYGVDLILPDWAALRERADDVHCVIITHGHEDHLGALPFFLRDFPGVRVYGTALTLGLVEARLAEHPEAHAELVEVTVGERLETGPFALEFVGMAHSVPDGMAVAFHTPHGTVLHSGDFKLDQTPIDGNPTDLAHLAALGDDGVALVLADSTNADRPGHVPSEARVGESLREVFARASGRIIVTTFASHIHRCNKPSTPPWRPGARSASSAGRWCATCRSPASSGSSPTTTPTSSPSPSSSSSRPSGERWCAPGPRGSPTRRCR
jgi:ribonuclease J